MIWLEYTLNYEVFVLFSPSVWSLISWSLGLLPVIIMICCLPSRKGACLLSPDVYTQRMGKSWPGAPLRFLFSLWSVCKCGATFADAAQYHSLQVRTFSPGHRGEFRGHNQGKCVWMCVHAHISSFILSACAYLSVSFIFARYLLYVDDVSFGVKLP